MTITPLNISREFPGVLGLRQFRSDAGLDTIELVRRVKSRIDRLRKCWDDNTTERQTAFEAARFLEEDQGQWLQKNPGESPEHWAQKPKITVDLANKVLRDVATVYQNPPRRLVSGEISEVQLDEAQEWLDDHLWSFGLAGLDATLLDLDRWLLFHGTIALEPRYQPDLDGLGVDGVEPIYYRRHEFEVLAFDEDPRRAEAVVFPVRKLDKRNQPSQVIDQEEVMHYWDAEVFARLKDWKLDPVEAEDDRLQGGMLVHDLGYMPIVFLRERLVQRSFYSPPVYPNLVRTAKSLNKLKTELAYFSMVPGSWYTDGDMQTANMGADAITKGIAGQQFDFRRMDADLAEIRANIQREIDDLGVAFGLAPGSLVMDPQSARSGVAIAAEQRDTDALRQERVPKWKRWEQRYHRAALDLYRVQSDQEPPAVLVSESGQAQAQVQVLHQRPHTQLSDAERREHLEFERLHGLIGIVDMLADLRSDLTAEEREARLERAREDASPEFLSEPIRSRIVRNPLSLTEEERTARLERATVRNRTDRTPTPPALQANGRVESQDG